MALTVKTPATERDLTTVSAVRDAIGITDDSFDPFLEQLIHAVSDAIERYTNRIYARQTYVETLRGHDHPILLVGQTPILSVVSVLCESQVVVDYVIDDAEIGSLYREAGWFRSAWVGWDVEASVIHGTEGPLYTVEYQAGYILPGEPNCTLPYSIQQAAVITASDFMMKSVRGGGDIKSKKVGDLVIEYQETAERASTQAGIKIEAIPSTARALLSVRVL
jgi:hypothetical protein